MNDSELPTGGISSPLNNSIRLSGYIAAFARHFNSLRFAFPVHDLRDGSRYDFDLYDVEREQLIKVLTSVDESQVEHCRPISEDPGVTLIIDADCLTQECEECGGKCFSQIPDRVVAVAEELGALILLADRFWTEDEGDGDWEKAPLWEHVRCLAALDELDQL